MFNKKGINVVICVKFMYKHALNNNKKIKIQFYLITFLISLKEKRKRERILMPAFLIYYIVEHETNIKYLFI